MGNSSNSIIQKISFSGIENKSVELYIKREDLIHPKISGNKYRKLKYNILQAKSESKNTLLTFGGAFSNHIAAVAAAGKENNFKTIGIIRGEELALDLPKTLADNSTLHYAHSCGMQFKFISRTAYRAKESKIFIDGLNNQFKDFYLIPEGGTNAFAIQGCEEILSDDTASFDFITSAVGTGGTISGLINSLAPNQFCIGFPALKGDFLFDEIKKYTNSENWNLNCKYHFGGYAKTSDDLIIFINKFKKETGIPLDPIYTGKMMYGLVDLINSGFFKKNQKILAIHTGGLQGVEGMNKLLKKKNKIIIV